MAKDLVSVPDWCKISKSKTQILPLTYLRVGSYYGFFMYVQADNRKAKTAIGRIYF